MTPLIILILRVLIFPGFLFLTFLTLFCEWFERKMMARMQNRIGPAYTGPHGILQPLADYIKLLAKEDITPRRAESLIFSIAPLLSFVIFMFSIFYLPIDGLNVFNSLGFEGDLIFVLAMITLAHFTLFLSGWSSSNPFSVVGATRILVQFLGYDIPLIMLATGPAVMAGSLSLQRIASKQTLPFAIVAPWIFIPFLLVLQAELEEDPFDIPHAETELVAGYGTEFSGRKFAFIRMSKDLQVVLGAALASTLFLGGPYGPMPPGPPALWFTLWFTIKVLLILFLIELIEAVCARLRIDHVVRANWSIMFPIALASLTSTFILAPWLQEVLQAIYSKAI
ncbi:TPA: NADH-quinone oxidoreductase subunit H [Candidatus Bathyarchaeota archaeon]|nr:NADH-quinone oxidoreductase subunit H [Candidatus Bathyarchaeota archaeon]